MSEYKLGEIERNVLAKRTGLSLETKAVSISHDQVAAAVGAG